MLHPLRSLVVALAVGASLLIGAPATSAQPADHTDAITVRTGKTVNASYKTQAVAYAKARGLTVRWVNGGACPQIPSSQGCYTSGKTQITLSNELRYAQAKQIKWIVAHEYAHHLIWKKCSTTSPAIVGSRTENVTDAYAHTVLKAGFSGMTFAKGYGFTAADAAVAKKIHAGTCSKAQHTITVLNAGVPFRAVADGRKLSFPKAGTKVVYLQDASKTAMLVRTGSTVVYLDRLAIAKTTKTYTAQASARAYRYSDWRDGKTVKGRKYGLIKATSSEFWLMRDMTNGTLHSVWAKGSGMK